MAPAAYEIFHCPSLLRPTKTDTQLTQTRFGDWVPPSFSTSTSHSFESHHLVPAFSGKGEGILLEGKGEIRLKLLTGNRPPSSPRKSTSPASGNSGSSKGSEFVRPRVCGLRGGHEEGRAQEGPTEAPGAASRSWGKGTGEHPAS